MLPNGLPPGQSQCFIIKLKGVPAFERIGRYFPKGKEKRRKAGYIPCVVIADRKEFRLRLLRYRRFLKTRTRFRGPKLPIHRLSGQCPEHWLRL